MSRVYAAAWVLVVVLETGCPVGGDAGVLHQALLKDEARRLAQDSCRPADIEDICEFEDRDECMAACIEEMERRERE
jgi:hypothetical protein